MILPFVALDAAFRASTPRDSVAILFLIEDSSEMSKLWTRLREFYLPRVLASIKDTNPSIPIQVLWMPTSQLSPIDVQTGSAGRRSRRWNEIPVLNFNQDSSTKVTPVAVSRAIDALSSASGGIQAIRHLVVIAVSNPAGDPQARNSTPSWIPLAHRLFQNNTRLHMIVRSQINMDGLTSLFWEMIKKDFSKPSVTDDTHYIFYLRNEAENASQSGLNTSSSQFTPPPTVAKPYDTMSNSSSSTPAASSTSDTQRPSLVFQLQKMNGMEKKRRSRARRDPVVTNKLGRPYQKAYSRNSLPSSPVEGSARPQIARSNTIGDVVGGVSRSISSGDNTSYPTTASTARSLSPSSPRYPFTNSHASSRAESQTAYDTFERALVSRSSPSLSPTSSGHLEYKSEVVPTGSIRSHYPITRSVNVRNIQPRVQAHNHYADVPQWRHHPQRDLNAPDFSYQQHSHSHFPSGPSASTGHTVEPTQDSPYFSHGDGYTEAAADISRFYPEYAISANYSFTSPGYETANMETAKYAASVSSPSSLHPPSFCDSRPDPRFFPTGR